MDEEKEELKISLEEELEEQNTEGLDIEDSQNLDDFYDMDEEDFEQYSTPNKNKSKIIPS